VVFPWADAKIVVFEFVSATDDSAGREHARAFHQRYFEKIRGVPGAAIITYTFPGKHEITSYRFEAVKVGKEQQAQMVLWGKTFADKDGVPLINARLALIEPPVGIEAEFRGGAADRGDSELEVHGSLRDVVTTERIDFSTIRNDVDALAAFVAGLVHYYKGAKSTEDETGWLLKRSIAGFQEYLSATEAGSDVSASALAHLFLARADYLLAQRSPDRRRALLAEAETQAAQAAKMNPYDADAFTVQAIIAAETDAEPELIREHLARAALLAPDDANVKFNLALLESGEGQFEPAIRQLLNVQALGASPSQAREDAELAEKWTAQIQARGQDR
jgi:tetratricopeptide (TPR) repeat protein